MKRNVIFILFCNVFGESFIIWYCAVDFDITQEGYKVICKKSE